MRKILVTLGVFILFSLILVDVYGDGGAIVQPVQMPAPGQTYALLENVELWLVHNPESISYRDVKAVIDGNEVVLSLKNITFCEVWQRTAEVWTAKVSLSSGEHTCQYFRVQSVKQSNGFWADIHVQTAKPFKFYVVGESQNPYSLNIETEGDPVQISATQNQDFKAVGICLLLAFGLSGCTIKTRKHKPL